MTKTVGRKPKFSVEEVRKVILMFRENVQPMGRIGYTDIYRYANELFEKGIILMRGAKLSRKRACLLTNFSMSFWIWRMRSG